MDLSTPKVPATSLTLRVQQLEERMMKTTTPTTIRKRPILVKLAAPVTKLINKYLVKIFTHPQDFCPPQYNAQETFCYLKSYIDAHPEMHWEENCQTDILYIYRYSKLENNTKEKVIACLNFLEKETVYLEKTA